jgi:predicted RNA-binding protein
LARDDDAGAAYLRKLEEELPPLDFTTEERHLDELLTVGKEVDVILNAQLMLEHKLIRLLERTGVADDMNGSFPLRSRLACDLGLISDARYRALFVVNRIRNKFAHELDYHLTAEDVSAVARHLDGVVIADVLGHEQTALAQMRAFLAYLWTHLDSDIEKRA